MSWSQREEAQDVPVQSSVLYEVYDVNAPLTIEPPDGAAGDALPRDVPIYPGAEIGLSAADMTTLHSPDAMGPVADFYREALSAEGWTLQAENDYAGNLIRQEWVKAGRSLQVDILAQDAGTQVAIRSK